MECRRNNIQNGVFWFVALSPWCLQSGISFTIGGICRTVVIVGTAQQHLQDDEKLLEPLDSFY